jgi:pilus assembly protein CpaB
MKGKSLALLVLALGCGLVASLGITQVLAKRGDSAPVDTLPLYVAKVEIPSGSLIPEESLKLEQWPKDRVPAGAVSRAEDLDGRRARQRIYAGEPIIDPKLLARGQVPTDGMVPKGLRVVPVPVGPEAIHSGLVLPGSRCDVQVFVKGCPNQGNCATFCKTILQDIKVFAVNDVTSTESKDPKSPDTTSIPGGKTVSLLVTPAQAQIVTLASQLGSIRLILRSGDDNDQPKTGVMTAQDLLGAGGGSDRTAEDPNAANEKRFQEWAEKIKQMLRENAKTAPTETRANDEQRFTMRIRTGADVNDVLLINNSSVQGLPGDEGSWTATGMGAMTHTKANPDARGPKPDDSGASASPVAQTPPRPAANLPIPTSPGSPRSPDGPWTSPVMPQSPGG